MASSISVAGQAVRPSHIAVPQRELDELRSRLERTRWGDEMAGTGGDYGVPVSYVRQLVQYWLDGYDWRKWEARINDCGPSETVIDGQRVHFLHVRSHQPDARPIILTHGWPGSIVEFLDVIAPLTDPTAHGGNRADAFHVVIPSLPGFGFSGPTTEPGWDNLRIARAWEADAGAPSAAAAAAGFFEVLLAGAWATEAGSVPEPAAWL